MQISTLDRPATTSSPASAAPANPWAVDGKSTVHVGTMHVEPRNEGLWKRLFPKPAADYRLFALSGDKFWTRLAPGTPLQAAIDAARGHLAAHGPDDVAHEMAVLAAENGATWLAELAPFHGPGFYSPDGAQARPRPVLIDDFSTVRAMRLTATNPALQAIVGATQIARFDEGSSTVVPQPLPRA